MKKYETYKAEKEVLMIRRKHLALELRRKTGKGFKAPVFNENGEFDDADEAAQKEINEMIDELNDCTERINDIDADMHDIDSALQASEDIGTKVTILRDMCGYTLKEIAEKLGYSYGYIRNLISKKCDKTDDS